MFCNKKLHVLKKFIVHVSTYDLLLPTSIKELKIFLHKIWYWMSLKFSLLEKLFDLCLHNNFLDHVKIFVCGKVPWSRKKKKLWKSSLIKEKFFVKISLTLKKLLNCGKVLWLWKNSMIKKSFLDCRKLTFLTAGKVIGLIFLKQMLALKASRQIF